MCYHPTVHRQVLDDSFCLPIYKDGNARGPDFANVVAAKTWLVASRRRRIQQSPARNACFLGHLPMRTGDARTHWAAQTPLWRQAWPTNATKSVSEAGGKNMKLHQCSLSQAGQFCYKPVLQACSCLHDSHPRSLRRRTALLRCHRIQPNVLPKINRMHSTPQQFFTRFVVAVCSPHPLWGSSCLVCTSPADPAAPLPWRKHFERALCCSKTALSLGASLKTRRFMTSMFIKDSSSRETLGFFEDCSS